MEFVGLQLSWDKMSGHGATAEEGEKKRKLDEEQGARIGYGTARRETDAEVGN